MLFRADDHGCCKMEDIERRNAPNHAINFTVLIVRV